MEAFCTNVVLLLYAFDKLTSKYAIVIVAALQIMSFVLSGYAVDMLSWGGMIMGYGFTTSAMTAILNMTHVVASPLLYVCSCGTYGDRQ